MKLQLALATMTVLGMLSSGCSSGESDPGSGGSSSGGASSSGGSGGSGGGSGGTTAGGSNSCNTVSACGGDLTGTWEVKSSCLKVSGRSGIGYLGLACTTAEITGSVEVTGTLTLGGDGKFKDETAVKGNDSWILDDSCLELSGTTVNCDGISTVFAATLAGFGYEEFKCVDGADGGCSCEGKINQTGGVGIFYNDMPGSGRYTSANNTLKLTEDLPYSYCVKDEELTVMPEPTERNATPYTGTVVFKKTGGGSGSGGAGGSTGEGGSSGSGGGSGRATGGTTGKGGSTASSTNSGGSTSSGGRAGRTGTSTGGTTGGSTGSTGGSTGGTTSGGPGTGPCDIYADANTPCVAAYSMVRVLSKSYKGPLFQVRAGSSSTNNTMSGGTTKDIMPGPDGFADTDTVDAACGSTYCTVSVLYDHSGMGNDLKRAPKGNTAGGATGALDDYESIATKGKVTAGGHQVYSLYMNKVEGYRSQVGQKGKSVPTGTQPQGTYELADGTRSATACCWDFGNVTPNPATEWRFMDTLCFGVTYWGKGEGGGPWFGADFEGGVWTGGSKVGDPGWGGLNDAHPVNSKNPSLKVPFAIGFLKVKSNEYSLRMADVSTASDLATAWTGAPPVRVDHVGGIVLGVGGDNSNNSWGTFYEGAIVAGYPTNDVELAIMKNVKAVGYTK